MSHINLSNHEIRMLNDFLRKATKDAKFDSDIFWFDGYLCAINSAVKVIPPRKWLNEIKKKSFKFKTTEQEEAITLLLAQFYNCVNEATNDLTYVPIYKWDKFKHFPQLEIARRWAKGYLFGTMVASEELLSLEEVNVALMPIVIISGQIPDEQLAKDGFSRAEMVDKIPDAVPLILELYNIVKDNFGGQNTWIPTTVVNNNKIARNDLCSCGSGRKYKKCCLAKKTTFN